ncbi:hypothetical protein LDBPK_290570 [Leishmania donovani]|uniref:Secreted protein n=1 Tax=Leishmania donovani TaxID=5661 RepID=E9BKK3_LEIDO|nr:hypothetical protein LDBPK_290570 [Leishmania donovani]CBZ35781.1 hypothetical protein LDBPK_290570 [Leishmania donovani]
MMRLAQRGRASIVALFTCASLLHSSCTAPSCYARRTTPITACIFLSLASPSTRTFSRSSVAGFLAQPLEGIPGHPPTDLHILTSTHTPTDRQQPLQPAALLTTRPPPLLQAHTYTHTHTHTHTQRQSCRPCLRFWADPRLGSAVHEIRCKDGEAKTRAHRTSQHREARAYEPVSEAATPGPRIAVKACECVHVGAPVCVCAHRRLAAFFPWLLLLRRRLLSVSVSARVP